MKSKIEFTIPFNPVTKKNHSRIIKRWVKTKTGRSKLVPGLIPSEQFEEYEQIVLLTMKKIWNKIDQIKDPVNVKAVYYMDHRRAVDLPNLHAALHDIMKAAGLVEDDNCNVIYTTDGSYVSYDKKNPRTEVEITFYDPGSVVTLKESK